MRYDIPLKDLFQQAPQQLVRLLTGCEAVEMLNVEYPSLKLRKPDLVVRLSNRQLYHLELQSRNDEDMLWRMLDYFLLIRQHYGIEPLQQVLYVGQEKPRFLTTYQSNRLSFHYELVDIRNIDCQILLQSDLLPDNILAILCRLDNPTQVLRTLLTKIYQLNNKQSKDMLLFLANLSTLRNLSPLLEQEKHNMALELTLEGNVFLQDAYRKGQHFGEEKGLKNGLEKGLTQGLKKGLKEGEATVLIRLLEKRFGQLEQMTKQRIMEASLEQLESWTDKIFDLQTIEQLFED